MHPSTPQRFVGHRSLGEGGKLLPRNCADTHAITRTQKGRRIFNRIEKLQRSSTAQFPATRGTHWIDSRLRAADANRTGRNFFAWYVAARRRQILWQPCQKCKTRNEANAGHAVFARAVKIDDFAFGKLCVFRYAIEVHPKF